MPDVSVATLLFLAFSLVVWHMGPADRGLYRVYLGIALGASWVLSAVRVFVEHVTQPVSSFPVIDALGLLALCFLFVGTALFLFVARFTNDPLP